MYNEFLLINKKFKSSVNLQYDLFNEEKIEQYIPTTDLCDVIKKYIISVLENNDKSTFLAGPYGKGKSYLMLIITYLFSNKTNKKLYENTLNKIKNIDEELSTLIEEIESKHIRLLPVIINNNNFDDLNQNFMIALNDSLNENNINNIIPKTAFTECLETIKMWENEDQSKFNILYECLRILKINLSELKSGLKNYDLKYYKKFENLYSCVTHGCTFNPLISNDISEIYYDVTKQIKKYGYTGLFVIFDEFGVFLENQTGNFARRLNKIQSFAEKCNASDKDSQMHFCCIAHKDFSLYNNDKDFFDNFEKVAGRFKQYRFDRSLDENYQILCSAILKKEKYVSLVDDIKLKNNLFFKKIFETSIFNSKNQIEYVINNGIPFNPISLYALIQVSEKVAQNERTLFTFLSDNDTNSFNYFITNNSSGFLNIDLIYDYFENLIKENKDYKEIYYKVNSLKKRTAKNINHLIFKSLAIFKIINDDIKFNATIENISLSLNIEYSIIENSINDLIKDNILKQNINNNSIDFSILPDVEINKIIDEIIESKITLLSLSDLLCSFDKDKFYLSNKYNFEFKMTRFYRSIYLEASKFKSLNDLDILFENLICDGLIIHLINDIKLTKNEIVSKLNISKGNIIVKYNTSLINKKIIFKIRKLYASKYLLNSKEKISNDIFNLLPLYIDDLTEEINNYLTAYNNSAICFNKYNYEYVKLDDCIYNSFINFYSKTIIFNNELINKNTPSSVSIKARNNVIDAILSNDKNTDDIFGSTSAEATIYNSFLNSIKLNTEFINFLKNWFVNECINRANCYDLVGKLRKSPYGMRNGIIPLFIAYTISLLTNTNSNSYDTILLYNESKEIEINALNLTKALDNSKNYYFYFKNISKDKIIVVERLLSYFKCNISLSFNENINLLIKTLKLKISNLPSIIVKATKTDNLVNLSEKAIIFKDLFLKHDINIYKSLFEDLPNIFNVDFSELYSKIICTFDEFDKSSNDFYTENIKKVIDIIGIKSTTIKSSFELWINKFDYVQNIIFETNENKLFKCFKNIIQYNDIDSINSLSYSILNCTLDDWNNSKQEFFYNTLYSLKNKIETFKIKENKLTINDNVKISNIGKTLYSNISETIEEYGDSISNEEKISILKKIIDEILD